MENWPSLGGALSKVWVPHDVRNHRVDFVRRWVERPDSALGNSSTRWRALQQVPRLARALQTRERLQPWYPLGYRRLTFTMLEVNVVVEDKQSSEGPWWKRTISGVGAGSRKKARPLSLQALTPSRWVQMPVYGCQHASALSEPRQGRMCWSLGNKSRPAAFLLLLSHRSVVRSMGYP